MAKRVKTDYDRGYVNAMDKIRVFIESSSKVMYVAMENETSMEVAPVESVVPAEAENPAYNNDCESSAGISFGTIVKVGAGAVLVGAAAVKFGIPLVKKGFNHIKESIASKKMKKNEVIDIESKEVPSDEETTEEE